MKKERNMVDLKSQQQKGRGATGSDVSQGNSETWGEWHLDAMDTLALAQYLETVGEQRELLPEKKLMLALLQDAVDCFRKNLFLCEGRKHTLFQEAEEWILLEGDSYLFSFDNVCAAFDIVPAYLRKGLMAYKQEKQKQRAA